MRPRPDNRSCLPDIAVIDATGGPAQPHMTVTIAETKIAGIERYSKGRVPKGARVIAGRGKFRIPGLWDMHAHWNDERNLTLFIANGVTGIRLMWGYDEHQQWRKRMNEGSLAGPRLSIASPIIDGTTPVFKSFVTVGGASEAREAVLNSRKGGADFIKIYSLLSREAYFAIADESRKEGIPFAGHVPIAIGLTEASDAGQHSVEHLTGVLLAASNDEERIRKRFVEAASKSPAMLQTNIEGTFSKELRDTFDPAKAAAVYARLASNHTWQTPTLTVLRALANLDNAGFTSDARLKYMPPSIRESWANPRSTQRTPDEFLEAKKVYELYVRIVGDMRRAGVPLLAGTDAPNPQCFPGFSLHDELVLFQRNGRDGKDGGSGDAGRQSAGEYSEYAEDRGSHGRREAFSQAGAQQDAHGR
jgi:imidazolonepropionase-like amidohydrolase